MIDDIATKMSETYLATRHYLVSYSDVSDVRLTPQHQFTANFRTITWPVIASQYSLTITRITLNSCVSDTVYDVIG